MQKSKATTADRRNGVTTSFLRWAGSKRQLLSPLAALFDRRFERYVEPFAGSACLFFRLAPAKAILSDLNPHLVSTLQCVKESPFEVASHLHALPTDLETYYQVREKQFESVSRVEQAARFIYLNRLCFNGLYRTNLKGKFNVPYGGTKGGQLPSTELLQKTSSALQSASIVCCDFEATLRDTKKGDFVYIDPPFSVRSRRVFREYDASLFGLKAIIRLKCCLDDLVRKEVSFVLSYAQSPEGDFLTSGLDVRNVQVRRSIASFSQHRTIATEVLAVSIAHGEA